MAKELCSRCKALDEVKHLVNYQGYLWHLSCLVAQIKQHVVSVEKRWEILKRFGIKKEQVYD